MTARNNPRGTAYEVMRSYLASGPGRAGLERLASLGGSWSPTEKPHVIVPALGQMDDAPELPKLETYRDRATFLAGACWLFAFIMRRASK